MWYQLPKTMTVKAMWLLTVLSLAGCGVSSAGTSYKGGAAETATESSVSSSAISDADTGTAPSSASNEVSIDNFKFSPRTLTVAVGTKVTWVNRDDVPHTATSTKKPKVFDSKTLDTDDKFSYVFKTTGTYEYFCAVHPHMKGQIVVK
jgi:plastocyanin